LAYSEFNGLTLIPLTAVYLKSGTDNILFCPPLYLKIKSHKKCEIEIYLNKEDTIRVVASNLINISISKGLIKRNNRSIDSNFPIHEIAYVNYYYTLEPIKTELLDFKIEGSAEGENFTIYGKVIYDYSPAANAAYEENVKRSSKEWYKWQIEEDFRRLFKRLFIPLSLTIIFFYYIRKKYRG